MRRRQRRWQLRVLQLARSVVLCGAFPGLLLEIFAVLVALTLLLVAIFVVVLLLLLLPPLRRIIIIIIVITALRLPLNTVADVITLAHASIADTLMPAAPTCPTARRHAIACCVARVGIHHAGAGDAVGRCSRPPGC